MNDQFPQTIGELLLERLDWLNLQPSHILEVGVRTGRLLKALRQKYPHASLYGIDVARHKLISQPAVICAKASHLPIANESIQLVISNLMLPWCDDVPSVLREFARVLKPTGRLLFSTLGPATLAELRQSWPSPLLNPFLDLHHLGDTLLQTGLQHPVVDVDWFDYKYPNIRHVLAELKNQGAFPLVRSLTGRHKFQAFLTAYERYRTPEGCFPLTLEVIYGYAQKPPAKNLAEK